ncbi:nuclear transport factor 2 family protein [Mycobacterium sp. D16R24]|uniref:nuclear transport factor 2 family protein n=1 Tax=Mycobacterium sp. D16R24 TaxID=1855656 RepID=UPI0009929EC6|nr:nuclear transport factor 2 family protein [Mycobacterium sp. D16R24]
MSSAPFADELLATVQASPAAVGAHDKDTWVGLFATYGQVNDPVGSRPHIGEAAISKFYDTFIAPNTIVFEVENDVVAGMSVLRDLTIHTTMSTGVTMHIPMHLRYDLVEDGPASSLKIDRLFAYWELRAMIGQLLGAGGDGLLASAKLGPQLLKNQGLNGVLGFMRGLKGVHATGKQRVEELAAALTARDIQTVTTLLSPEATLSLDGVAEASLTEFASATGSLAVDKLLAAGSSVSATVRLGDRRGVGLFEFSDNSAAPGTLASVRLYF